MPLQIEIDPTPLSSDEHGTVRVAGTRITLESVLWLYKQGYAAEAVVEAFPTLSLPDVYSVVAYYLRHQPDVERYLAQRQDQAETLRQNIEQELGRGPTKAELLARWAQTHGGNGAGRNAPTPD